jgi:hypothetical protein
MARRMPSSVKPAPAALPAHEKMVGPSKKPAQPGAKFPGKSPNMGAKIKRTSDMPKPANA